MPRISSAGIQIVIVLDRGNVHFQACSFDADDDTLQETLNRYTNDPEVQVIHVDTGERVIDEYWPGLDSPEPSYLTQED